MNQNQKFLIAFTLTLISRESSRCSSPQAEQLKPVTVKQSHKKQKVETAGGDSSHPRRVPLLNVESDSDGDKEDKVNILFV